MSTEAAETVADMAARLGIRLDGPIRDARGRAVLEHGTVARYRKGCTDGENGRPCEECVAANREVNSAKYRRRRDRQKEAVNA